MAKSSEEVSDVCFFCEHFSEDESGEQVQITHETSCEVIES